METILTQIQNTSAVEWLGTATGLIGVYLSIKEKAVAWLFYIVCYILYVYLSFKASLFAAMVLNAIFIPISAWGWIQWGRSSESSEKPEVRISKTNPNQYLWLVCIAILGTAGLGLFLQNFTEGILPYLDAFATIVSLMAQWMLGRKLLENWLAWIIADSCFIVLWGWQGYWVALSMFLVFTFLATSGYLTWKKELSETE